MATKQAAANITWESPNMAALAAQWEGMEQPDPNAFLQTIWPTLTPDQQMAYSALMRRPVRVANAQGTLGGPAPEATPGQAPPGAPQTAQPGPGPYTAGLRNVQPPVVTGGTQTQAGTMPLGGPGITGSLTPESLRALGQTAGQLIAPTTVTQAGTTFQPISRGATRDPLTGSETGMGYDPRFGLYDTAAIAAAPLSKEAVAAGATPQTTAFTAGQTVPLAPAQPTGATPQPAPAPAPTLAPAPAPAPTGIAAEAAAAGVESGTRIKLASGEWITV